jgi:hypothetical protein
MDGTEPFHGIMNDSAVCIDSLTFNASSTIAEGNAAADAAWQKFRKVKFWSGLGLCLDDRQSSIGRVIGETELR